MKPATDPATRICSQLTAAARLQGVNGANSFRTDKFWQIRKGANPPGNKKHMIQPPFGICQEGAFGVNTEIQVTAN